MSHCDTCRHLTQEGTFAGAFDVCGLLSRDGPPGLPARLYGKAWGYALQVVDAAAFGCTLHEPREER